VTTSARRPPARLPAAILTAAGLAGIPAALPAQDSGFRENVSVRVMDIDVVVTDPAGRPVPDLPRDAFQIRVDRRPVDVDYFAAVRDGELELDALLTRSWPLSALGEALRTAGERPAGFVKGWVEA